MDIKSEIEYQNIVGTKGALVFLKPIPQVKYGEIVKIRQSSGKEKLGKVLDLASDFITVQLYEDSSGIDVKKSTVRFTGELLSYEISEKLLGRILDGKGNPIDDGPKHIKGEKIDISGLPINPVSRKDPDKFVETGISAIDLMMSFVTGQKLPIFSGSGLPHEKIAMQIVNQVTFKGKFAVVFAGLGITQDEARFFTESLKAGDNLDRTVMLLNFADDPAAERLLTPRIALSIAEYLAFTKDYQVIALITDMTPYCNALREISSLRNEIPGRKGYPGYLYSDLTTIYERCGQIHGRPGSLTLIPILTMPSDDITHPIPDLTGYITEGQILLSRDLHLRGVYPPLDVIPSLSRLMKDGTGKGKTRDDHFFVANQLYDAYANGLKARELASVIGEANLTKTERRYLSFINEFEDKFLRQDFKERRALSKSLEMVWELLESIPEDELTHIPKELIEQYRESKK